MDKPSKLSIATFIVALAFLIVSIFAYINLENNDNIVEDASVSETLDVAEAASGGKITCINIDSNKDKSIDVKDFAKFAQSYGKKCK
jgi:hypothetical protein